MVEEQLIDAEALYGKPVEYKFSNEEIKAIQERHPRDGFRVLYGFWKQLRRNGFYIWVAIDQMPSSPRRSPFLTSSHLIGYRPLSEIEHYETASNYGRNNRRFIVWHYRNIDGVIADDAKYGIETPKNIIDKYKKLL